MRLYQWSTTLAGLCLLIFGGRMATSHLTETIIVADHTLVSDQQLVSIDSAIRNPIWSPDGQWILIPATHCCLNSFKLFRIRADGSEIEQLIDSVGLFHPEPVWSPDGQWIVFGSEHTDNWYQLLKMRADGSEIQQLTFDSAFRPAEPQWSPDGQWIVFSAYEYGVGHGAEIYKMRADGSERQQLTYDDAHAAGLRWSSDGEWIVFTISKLGASGNYYSRFYQMRADGSDRQQLTFNPYNSDPDPTLSPDSQWSVFSIYRDDGSSLYLKRADGSQFAQITHRTVEKPLKTPSLTIALLGLGAALIIRSIMVKRKFS